MTQVAFLWHMHQPFYEDLATGEHILPWVRLHALKDYYGMVALLEEFPAVRMTFNLVPSLLVQLEAFAAERAHDRSLDLSLKPADELTAGDVDFIVEHFFHAQRERMIDAHPRYRELCARRGGGGATGAEGRAVARRFSTDDLRDLQVWHKLAWIDPDLQQRDARVAGLIARGGQFTEVDKTLLREVELEILRRVIPAYRDAAARGQIELSTSPFYHPILPLLCDTDVYLRIHPGSKMPRRRFEHPEDAALQLERAVSYHERVFGRRPAGLWPSEGSVSDAMVPLVAAAGLQWMATDELILARTLNIDLPRDPYGHLERPDQLYAPYSVRVGDAAVRCVFRDHVLSDLIGFTYARWPAEAAAEDFVGRLLEAGRRYRDSSGGGEALVSIILDGENAWEYFEGGGRPFLRALYRRLAGHPELRTVTMSEATAGASRELGGIRPGSWIDADFYVWIGHADDQKAWTQLADARQALDEAPGDQPARDRALEELLIAEGSDWCWWYGDDHSSAQDREFDELFRRHVRNVYRLLGTPVPEELFVSNISARAATGAHSAPAGRVTPTIDGENTSYFEWLAAGMLEIRATDGAMHQGGPAPLVRLIHYGFGRDCLSVRVDTTRPMADLLAEGYAVSIAFLEPAGIRLSAAAAIGPHARLTRQAPGAQAVEVPGHFDLAAATILEVSLPLERLGLREGDPVAFVIEVSRQGDDGERHPSDSPIELTVPGPAGWAGSWAT